MFIRGTQIVATAICAWLLMGCGPVGPSAPSPFAPGPDTEPVPLRVGFQALVKQQRTHIMNARGACTGIAKLVIDATAAADFEGINGFKAGESLTFDTPGCSALNIAGSLTRFYDMNYAPTGESTPGKVYAQIQGAGVPLPLTVQLGDNAPYATFNLFADSTKAVNTGTRVLSYLVEQETIRTVLIGLMARDYDPSGKLLRTRTDHYRLAGNGQMELRSIDFLENVTGESVQLTIV